MPALAEKQPKQLHPQAVAPDSEALAHLLAAIADLPRNSGGEVRGPFAAMELVREARLSAFRLPRSEGGGGANLRQFFAMLIKLAEANSEVAHILRAHFWFTEERLRSALGPERERWLARIRNGEIFGNAMSELGGNAAVGSWAFQTTLVPEDTGFRLSGEKFYCTGSIFSDWVNVFAVLPNGELASACIPTRRTGVELLDDWDGIGQHYTGSGSAVFHNVRVEAEEVFRSSVDAGEVADQIQRPDPYLIGQICQLILTAIIAGILHRAVKDARQLVLGRSRTFSHAAASEPANDPLIQQIIGEISAAAFAAEAVVLAAAEAQDRALAAVGTPAAFSLAHEASVQAAQAKIATDDLAQRAANRLFEAGGASAVRAQRGLHRHWLDIRTLSSHNPTLYKARSVGEWILKGTVLPNSGFFQGASVPRVADL